MINEAGNKETKSKLKLARVGYPYQLSRGRSEQLLKDVQILKEGKLFPLEKIKRAIQQNYSKSQYFEDYSAKIYQIMDTETDYYAI